MDRGWNKGAKRIYIYRAQHKLAQGGNIRVQDRNKEHGHRAQDENIGGWIQRIGQDRIAQDRIGQDRVGIKRQRAKGIYIEDSMVQHSIVQYRNKGKVGKKGTQDQRKQGKHRNKGNKGNTGNTGNTGNISRGQSKEIIYRIQKHRNNLYRGQHGAGTKDER